jgi:hypothetical protein
MPHAFTFFRAGGFDQVRLQSAADLVHLGELDRKLWAALACPVKGLEFDERTLQLIDSDGDGRVRAPELLAAVAWTCARLNDPWAISARRERLPLAAISTAKPDNAALLGCARRVLERVGTPGASDIGVADIAGAAGELAKTAFNGDGVMPSGSANDARLAQAITDILTTRPAVRDSSGADGLDRVGLAGFVGEATAWLAWWDAGAAQAAHLPLGDRTPAAAAAVAAVRAKVDDWFLRNAAAAFDARAAAQLSRSEAEWAALAVRDLASATVELAGFPLAGVRAGAALALHAGINPAWSAAIATLHRDAIVPLLGERSELSEADWRTVCNRLDGYRTWSASEPHPAIGRLGAARVRELLDPAVQAGLQQLFAKDLEVQPEFAALGDLERLVRFHRDLFCLLNNFVALSDLYDPAHPAIFQSGTLYLDGRASQLCVEVGDMARHGLLAGRSNAFLVYADCMRAGVKRTVCAAMTNGDAQGLFVGRNGLFIDRKGQDWDATVVKVVENPISIREAFWSPYKRVVRFVEDFAAKRAAEADKASDAKLQGATAAVAVAAPSEAQAKPKIDVGTVAALGVAVGGITTALGLMLNAFFGLGWLIPLGVVGLILAISGPSMVLAWLKLRTRSVGPILDANGWAVNGNARINIPFGAALTALASLPLDAKRIVGDPYAEKRSPWRLYVLLVLVLCGATWSGLDRWIHGSWWCERLVAVPVEAPVEKK